MDSMMQKAMGVYQLLSIFLVEHGMQLTLDFLTINLGMQMLDL